MKSFPINLNEDYGGGNRRRHHHLESPSHPKISSSGFVRETDVSSAQFLVIRMWAVCPWNWCEQGYTNRTSAYKPIL
jgi:hypothetical protein